jgi:hypothetical protein
MSYSNFTYTKDSGRFHEYVTLVLQYYSINRMPTLLYYCMLFFNLSVQQSTARLVALKDKLNKTNKRKKGEVRKKTTFFAETVMGGRGGKGPPFLPTIPFIIRRAINHSKLYMIIRSMQTIFFHSLYSFQTGRYR